MGSAPVRFAAETVADAPDGFDIDGRGGIRLDLFMERKVKILNIGYDIL